MKNKNIFFLIVLMFCLSSCSLNGKSDQDDFTLTVAHINDTHSAFDPSKSSFIANDQLVYNEFGGYPRVFQKSNEYRDQAQQKNKSFLFLHAGDAWQGSAYFKINEGLANADLLSQMKIDTMVLGNHEFDLSNDKLNQFIEKVSFPVLASNIDVSEDEYLKDQKISV